MKEILIIYDKMPSEEEETSKDFSRSRHKGECEIK